MSAGKLLSASILAGDAGQRPEVVAGARKEVTFSTTTNQAVASTDCSNYRWVSIQFTTYGGGTTTFQTSNDNVNWSSHALIRADGTGSGQAQNVVTEAISGSFQNLTVWQGVIGTRYFRLSITGISGTIAGTAQFFTVAPVPTLQHVVIDGAFQSSGAVAVSATTTYPPADSMTSRLFPSALEGWNGASWDRFRVPTISKTATATASGDTALWTPTSGKKFRLMCYRIEVTGDAATSGGAEIDVVLRDATTATAAATSLYVPAVGSTGLGSYASPWVDLGNGILSASANNVLNINLSAALSTGKVRVVCCGTEE